MPGTNKRITKRLVEALKPGSIIWDTDVKGFGVRCQRRDKIYVLKTRTGGRQRWFSIGPHGSPWTPEKARTRAKRILGEIADRKDPATLRDASKRNPTVADLTAMFLHEHVEAKRKPSTAKGYRDFLERLALPKIGQFKVADVTRSDVARLHHSQRRTPYQANRLLAVLAKMFAWAEQHGFREDGTNTNNRPLWSAWRSHCPTSLPSPCCPSLTWPDCCLPFYCIGRKRFSTRLGFKFILL